MGKNGFFNILLQHLIQISPLSPNSTSFDLYLLFILHSTSQSKSTLRNRARCIWHMDGPRSSLSNLPFAHLLSRSYTLGSSIVYYSLFLPLISSSGAQPRYQFICYLHLYVFMFVNSTISGFDVWLLCFMFLNLYDGYAGYGFWFW